MPDKILLVDDEADICRMISDCLRLYGYEVVTADTPQLAIQLAAKTPFNVIILDVNMADLAGRDGSNLMAAMKRKHPQTPVILYTGMSTEDGEVQDMLKQGAVAHVSKGDTLEVLLRAVQKAAQPLPNKPAQVSAKPVSSRK
jgi:DNA-binding NtrC family response regulator